MEMSTASTSSTSTSTTLEFCANLAEGVGAATARPSQADAPRSVQTKDNHEDRIIMRILLLRHAATKQIGGKRGNSANSRLRDVFRGLDFDAETGHADIGRVGGNQQTNAGNAKILEDLRAEPDFTPLFGANAFGRVALGRCRH